MLNLYFINTHISLSIFFTTSAKLPTATSPTIIDFVTTNPGPTIIFLSTISPKNIMAFSPIQSQLSNLICFASVNPVRPNGIFIVYILLMILY